MTNQNKRSSTGLLHKSAQVLGHYGGVKGGPAKAEKLTSAKRASIASQGGKAKARKY